MAYEVGYVLERHPVGAEQGDEGVAQLPRHPFGPQACSCSDLPEVAQDAVTIKGHADR